MKRPPKLKNLLETVRICIEEDRFIDTRHSEERQAERDITRREVRYVLKNGWHERSKDEYLERYKAWNYAIRSMTLEDRDLRVIVSFDSDGMLIITAIEIE